VHAKNASGARATAAAMANSDVECTAVASSVGADAGRGVAWAIRRERPMPKGQEATLTRARLRWAGQGIGWRRLCGVDFGGVWWLLYIVQFRMVRFPFDALTDKGFHSRT